MKKKIAYILTSAAIGIAAFLIGRNTIITTVDTEPEVYSDNINVANIVDWNTDGQELAVFTSDGYEYYAYKSEDIYGDNDNHYINVLDVTAYTATEDGLQLYLADGTGYWIEK